MEINDLIRRLRSKKIVKDLSAIVKNVPYKTWLVGGSIRDAYLGVHSQDYDIAITGDPEHFIKLISQKLKGKYFALDSKRNEYRIMLPSERIVDVKPIKNIEQDISERDFTINAIALNLKNLSTIYDPLNGIDDLQESVLRAVNKNVFKEDPLRLLRLFRFSSSLGLTISDKTLELARKNVQKIETTASERIKAELFCIMGTPKSYPYIIKMEKIGLLGTLFPDIEKGKSVPQHKYRSKNLKEHSLVSYDIMEKIIDEKRYSLFEGFIKTFQKFIEQHKVLLKISSLLHDIGKIYAMKRDSSGTLHFWSHEKKGETRLKNFYKDRLALSKKETEILCLMILHHMRVHLLSREDTITKHALYRFVKAGKDSVPGILLISYADSISSSGSGPEVKRVEKTIKKIIEYYKTCAKIKRKKRLLTGDDLIHKFELSPGPIFTTILDAVEKARIDGKVTNKKEAIEFVSRLLKNFPE